MSTNKGTLKALRLVSHKLVNPRGKSPGRVVEWLGGVQAQNEGWAKWSIGLRTDGCNEVDVERAIQNRQFVRTWMFRGTLHFVAAGDLCWLRSLLAPGVIRRNARRYRDLELDDAVFAKSQKAIQHALESHGPLTRSEIKTHFEKEAVPAEGQQVPYLLQRAALEGLICFGPPRGREPTFVLVSDWIGAQKNLDRVQALGRLATLYLSSHGPATQQDFAWWSGLTAQEARLAVDSTSGVTSMEADGVQYWVVGDPPLADDTETGYLLPPFDEYLLGYKRRSLVLGSTHAKRVNAGGGFLKPTLMVQGDVLGIWNYTMSKKRLAVSIEPFRDLESHERDLIEQAASRLSSFKSLPVRVSIGPRDAGLSLGLQT